jgi:hypothetical protein
MKGDSLGHELITTGGQKGYLAIRADEKDQSLPFQTESNKDKSKCKGSAPIAHTRNSPPPTRDHIFSGKRG